VVAAPPPVLRFWGVELADRHGRFHEGSRWSYPDYPKNMGDVQILERFTSRVTAAVDEKARLFPNTTGQRLTDEDRAQVWESLKRRSLDAAP
jgi:hypothetical protein